MYLLQETKLDRHGTNGARHLEGNLILKGDAGAVKKGAAKGRIADLAANIEIRTNPLIAMPCRAWSTRIRENTASRISDFHPPWAAIQEVPSRRASREVHIALPSSAAACHVNYQRSLMDLLVCRFNHNFL